LSNGLEAVSIERTGLNPIGGFYASDHAGVVAAFAIAEDRAGLH